MEFEQVIEKWVSGSRTFTQEDVICLLLEYSKVFGNGNATPQQILTLLSMPMISWNNVIEQCIRKLGVYYKYDWIEILDTNGNWYGRCWNKKV